MTHPAPDDEQRFLRLLGGKWITAAIAAAARLGVAPLLVDADGHDRPLGVDAIAERLGAHAPSLERLLRVLAAEGLLTIDDTEGDRFALTELGRQLLPDAMGSLAAFVGMPFMWDPWSALPQAVRTGETAFEQTYGRSLFTYLDEEETDQREYHEAVDAFTRRQARSLAQTFDFAEVNSVVDVGGGIGTLVLELVDAWPHLEATLFDRAPIAARAAERFAELGVADRCQTAGGSFFEELPSGKDVYVVKHVLHNWDDEPAAEILKRCAEAAHEGSVLLVVEGILLPGVRPDGTRLLDLEMLVLCGAGRERSKREFRELFRAGGWKLESTWPLAGGVRLIVGRRR